jgi:hypothetical protein
MTCKPPRPQKMKTFTTRNLLNSRPNSSLKLLQGQATLTLKGLDLLKDYMQGQEPVVAQQLTGTEKEADEVRRILIDELNRTFVTPMDREDIFALSRTIDEMEILRVKPTPYMCRIAGCCAMLPLRFSRGSSASRSIPGSPTNMPSAPRRWRTGWKACTAKPWPIYSTAPRTCRT